MQRFLVALIVGTAAAAPVSAFAQSASCTEQVAQFDAMTKAVTDDAKRATVAAEIKSAKEAAAKQDEKSCMSHLTKAMEAVK